MKRLIGLAAFAAIVAGGCSSAQHAAANDRGTATEKVSSQSKSRLRPVDEEFIRTTPLKYVEFADNGRIKAFTPALAPAPGLEPPPAGAGLESATYNDKGELIAWRLAGDPEERTHRAPNWDTVSVSRSTFVRRTSDMEILRTVPLRYVEFTDHGRIKTVMPLLPPEPCIKQPPANVPLQHVQIDAEGRLCHCELADEPGKQGE
jgi:hypothetical protein